jgi:hypothetical protein
MHVRRCTSKGPLLSTGLSFLLAITSKALSCVEVRRVLFTSHFYSFNGWERSQIALCPWYGNINQQTMQRERPGFKEYIEPQGAQTRAWTSSSHSSFYQEAAGDRHFRQYYIPLKKPQHIFY